MKHDNSNAVSEMIGTMMMILIVVSAVGVIAVFAFSQPAPQSIPHINFLAGTGNGDLYLYHNGGDVLRAGTFSVIVDGVSVPYEMTDSEWTLGDTITIRGVSGLEHSVQIVYENTNSVLSSVSISESDPIIPPSPDIVIPLPTPTTLDSCVDIGFQDESCYQFVSHDAILDMFMVNVTANYITFYKETSRTAPIESGQYVQFKVTGMGSTITWEKGMTVNVQPLYPNDVVRVTLDAKKHIKTFGLAPAIWELTTDSARLQITNATQPIDKSNVAITHTWITEYDPATFESTITIHVDGSSNTALTTGNSIPKINGVDSREIYLDNVQPLSAGLFLIEVDNSNHNVYFVGNATNIRSNPPL